MKVDARREDSDSSAVRIPLKEADDSGEHLAHPLAPMAWCESGGSHRLLFARAVIAVSAGLACAVVALLKHYGFQIEDLIFSIYGGALALFPPILIALLCPRQRLVSLGRFALMSIVLGFLMGWGIAFYGKLFQVQNAVFMSPAVGMFTSFVIMGCALLATRHRGRTGDSARSQPR